MEEIKGKRRYTVKHEGKRFLSLPTVANLIEVRHLTVYRWVTKKPEKLHELGIQIIRDPQSKHYYLDESSVEKLKNRFKPVE